MMGHAGIVSRKGPCARRPRPGGDADAIHDPVARVQDHALAPSTSFQNVRLVEARAADLHVPQAGAAAGKNEHCARTEGINEAADHDRDHDGKPSNRM